jgi:hypothetical protein
MMIFNLNFLTGQTSSRVLSRLVHNVLAAFSAVLTVSALPILRSATPNVPVIAAMA